MDIEKLIKDVRDTVVDVSEHVANSILDSDMFDKYRNSPDKTEDFLNNLSSSVNSAGEHIGDWLGKTKEQSEPWIRKTKASIYEKFYAEYRKAGLPYGDNHEGFMTWVKENAADIRTSVERGLDKGREAILDAAAKAKTALEKVLTPVSKEETPETDPDPKEVELIIDRVIKDAEKTES